MKGIILYQAFSYPFNIGQRHFYIFILVQQRTKTWIPIIFTRIILLIPSMVNRNRSGDNGNPCHNPLLGLKKGEATPLMRIEKATN